jgi:predicted nucleotidyltransferase component of viral defense system
MIDRDEIKAKADEFDIHHANVERDYVFGWLLKSIFENDYLRNVLVFKGGNCLRKAFYPETRFSSDLDFSATDALDQERIASEINQACRAAEAACGVQFLVDRNTFEPGKFIDRERRSYKGRVYFTDFFGNQDDLTISVKVDVTEFDRLHIAPVTRTLIHPYSDSRDCAAVLRCMAIEEIVANKLKCLIQRRHSHDLFDLVYATVFDRSIEVDRASVLRVFLAKTIFGSSPGAAKKILLGLPMTFFGGVWDKFIRCPKRTRVAFDRAAEGFRETIETLFQDTGSGRGEYLFFASEHRNLILEAGAGRKLLRLTYDHVERLVEPYALSYKRAAGQPAREYFYAYDRTGGRSSAPGIRSFLNTKMHRIELTDEKFEPRYEIELSQAGEQFSKGHFGRSFSPPGTGLRGFGGFRLAAARSRASSPTFKVQCPYCQKLFTRMTSSVALNPHKAPNGYACAGRQGYRVF